MRLLIVAVEKVFDGIEQVGEGGERRVLGLYFVGRDLVEYGEQVFGHACCCAAICVRIICLEFMGEKENMLRRYAFWSYKKECSREKRLTQVLP